MASRSSTDPMPSPPLMRYLICYDSPDQKRRARVAKILEGRGFRVQWSVFECQLTPPLLDELRRDLQAEVDPEEDSVRLYPICESCSRGVRSLGLPDPYGLERDALLF